jgi:hypothetical protein
VSNYYDVKEGSTLKPYTVTLQDAQGGPLAAESVKLYMHDTAGSFRLTAAEMGPVAESDPDYEPGMWAYVLQPTEVVMPEGAPATARDAWFSCYIEVEMGGRVYYSDTASVRIIRRVKPPAG